LSGGAIRCKSAYFVVAPYAAACSNTGFPANSADASELTITTTSACASGYYINTAGTSCTTCGTGAATCTSGTPPTI